MACLYHARSTHPREALPGFGQRRCHRLRSGATRQFARFDALGRFHVPRHVRRERRIEFRQFLRRLALLMDDVHTGFDLGFVLRFARARGLTTRAIHFGHALKNTLVPVITVAGLQFGSVIAFAIITETVFQWPGMGLLFVQAVQNVDIPIMAAYLLVVSLIFVTINLIVDILYTVVDPRLRSTISRAA